MEQKLYVICQFASESKTLVVGVTRLLRLHGNFHILWVKFTWFVFHLNQTYVLLLVTEITW